jgi:hypothetical protein
VVFIFPTISEKLPVATCTVIAQVVIGVTSNVYDMASPVKSLTVPLVAIISPPVKIELETVSLNVTVKAMTCHPLIVEPLPGEPVSITVGILVFTL